MMGLRFGIPLPGPFYYTARVFPRTRSCRPARKAEPVSPESVVMGLYLVLIPAVLIGPAILLGPLGLLSWPLFGWWLVRRVLRRRREEREPVEPHWPLLDTLEKDKPAEGWRTYQASLLD